MNGYAYCGGDPVNRVDPTGHTPAFLKPLLRGLRLMKKPTPATNIKKIADGIHSFETASKNQLSLTFFGHGNRTPKNGGHSLLSAGKNWTPEQLYNASTKAGINFEQYKDINMVMCYSANGGPNSFIRSFSALTEKPVTGYINTVRVSPTPDIFQNLISSESARIRRLGNGTYSFDQGVKIYTKNPLNVKNDGHHAFEYSPVTYESTRL